MYLEYLFTDWEVKAEADFKRRKKKEKKRAKILRIPTFPAALMQAC